MNQATTSTSRMWTSNKRLHSKWPKSKWWSRVLYRLPLRKLVPVPSPIPSIRINLIIWLKVIRDSTLTSMTFRKMSSSLNKLPPAITLSSQSWRTKMNKTSLMKRATIVTPSVPTHTSWWTFSQRVKVCILATSKNSSNSKLINPNLIKGYHPKCIWEVRPTILRQSSHPKTNWVVTRPRVRHLPLDSRQTICWETRNLIKDSKKTLQLLLSKEDTPRKENEFSILPLLDSKTLFDIWFIILKQLNIISYIHKFNCFINNYTDCLFGPSYFTDTLIMVSFFGFITKQSPTMSPLTSIGFLLF